MFSWIRDRVFTLWDLAEAVNEEVDSAVAGERDAVRVADAVLVHLIRFHVRNVWVIGEPGDGIPGPGSGRDHDSSCSSQSSRRAGARRVPQGAGAGRATHGPHRG